MIAKEVFIEWKSHPVTEEMMSRLQEDLEIIRESYESGSFLGYPEENAKAVGMLIAINNILAFNPVEE